VGVEPSEISTGSIVWAMVRDQRGYRKRRPAIVLTPTSEISLDEPILLVAITTTYPEPPPSDCLELPWNPDPRRVATGLGYRSAAVVSWLEPVYLDEVDSLVGRIPPRLLMEIQRRVSGFDELSA
jgi:hypothetical protein